MRLCPGLLPRSLPRPAVLRRRRITSVAEGSRAPSVFVSEDLRAKLLSWGFPKISSPPASESHVHSRMVAHPSARGCQPPRSFRPCRSSRLRRFPPCDPLQVCLTLQPVLRFAAFQIFRIIAPARLRSVRPTLRSSPAAPFTPFRAFPSSCAVPRHRGPCLLIVLSTISRLYSSDESVVSTPRRRVAGPDALLGFVPLQGSPLSLNLLQSVLSAASPLLFAAESPRCRASSSPSFFADVHPLLCGVVSPWRPGPDLSASDLRDD